MSRINTDETIVIQIRILIKGKSDLKQKYWSRIENWLRMNVKCSKTWTQTQIVHICTNLNKKRVTDFANNTHTHTH